MDVSIAGIIALLTLIVGLLVKFVGVPDQIRKNHINKSTDGLSTPFVVISFFAYVLWTMHGVLIGDWVLIIGQGLGIFVVGIILVQIMMYRKA